MTTAAMLTVETERRTIQSVERALDILERLAASGEELRLKEIAAATSLNVSTCHHIVATLVMRGYLSQNPRTRAYGLGNSALALSRSRAGQIDLARVAQPDLEALNRETRETVHFEVLRGTELATLVKLDALHVIRVGTDAAGKVKALHATATGKAILAWLPDAELKRILAANGQARYTDRTIVGYDALVDCLRHVRRNGHAIDCEEFLPGVVCVGSAVRDHTGAVIGAVSCSMPAMRAGEAEIEAARRRVLACASALSEKLGNPQLDGRSQDAFDPTGRGPPGPGGRPE